MGGAPDSRVDLNVDQAIDGQARLRLVGRRQVHATDDQPGPRIGRRRRRQRRVGDGERVGRPPGERQIRRRRVAASGHEEVHAGIERHHDPRQQVAGGDIVVAGDLGRPTAAIGAQVQGGVAPRIAGRSVRGRPQHLEAVATARRDHHLDRRSAGPGHLRAGLRVEEIVDGGGAAPHGERLPGSQERRVLAGRVQAVRALRFLKRRPGDEPLAAVVACALLGVRAQPKPRAPADGIVGGEAEAHGPLARVDGRDLAGLVPGDAAVGEVVQINAQVTREFGDAHVGVGHHQHLAERKRAARGPQHRRPRPAPDACNDPHVRSRQR